MIFSAASMTACSCGVGYIAEILVRTRGSWIDELMVFDGLIFPCSTSHAKVHVGGPGQIKSLFTRILAYKPAYLISFISSLNDSPIHSLSRHRLSFGLPNLALKCHHRTQHRWYPDGVRESYIWWLVSNVKLF